MPITPNNLLQSCGLMVSEIVAWNEPVSCTQPGIYIISREQSLNAPPNALACPKECNNYSDNWLPNECILYIGKTNQPLKKRIGQYYEHKFGQPSPHSGGEWIKLLIGIVPLWVIVVPAEEPREREKELLGKFEEEAGALPFANRQH